MTDVFTTSWGEEIPIIIETRRGLRNISLRPKIAPKREIRISKPWLATTASALRFINEKRGWLEKHFARAPVRHTIRDGDTIEFLGRDIMIRHIVGNSAPRIVGQELQLGGDAAHLERRVRDFIKKELLTEIKNIIKTVPREFWPKRISLRDTTSRWGSCSTTGTISFSWRLAFAPYDVMRYVVMHELAHCRHMNHSPDFWATVAALYGEGVGRAKRWLSIHGGELHKYF